VAAGGDLDCAALLVGSATLVSERSKDSERLASQRAAASSVDRRLTWGRLAESLFGDAPQPVQLGPYAITRELGRGTSGTVYLARDALLQRDVAVKVLHPGPGSSQAVVHEARALARLSAPNVVSVYGVGEHEGLVYIAMELAVGPTLRQWQAQSSRSRQDVLDAYRQAGLGLQAAHERGIIHRDFKPDNVRVGPDGRVLVFDFGFATDGEHAASAMHSGTPAYMSPEQMSANAADARADQFAFCVALYEALFGQRPFEHDAGPARLDEIRAARVLRPSTNQVVPRDVFDVLRRGMSCEPESRFASMRQLLDELSIATATSAEQRARQTMLTRIESFWIDGVLRASLDGSEPLPLQLSTQPELSHGPWREGAARDRPAIPPGEAITLARALEREPDCLVLLGPAGAGKTTLLLQLAAVLVRRARQDDDAPLPIVLNLSTWDEHESLTTWLVAEVQARYGIPPARARPWIDGDGVMLLLDGVDEVSESRRSACVAAIDDWCARSLRSVVLTSRPPLEDSAPWPRSSLVVAVQPLSSVDIDRVIEARPALRALRDTLKGDPDLADLARNPLVLTLLCETHLDAEPHVTAPRAREQLWQVYVRRMLAHRLCDARHPAATVERALRFVARRMCQERHTELWVEEIQPAWLDERWLRVLHGGLSLVLVALGSAVLTGLFMGATVGTLGGLWSAGLTLAIAAAFVAGFAGVGRISPVYRLVWSWARWRAGLRTAALRAATGAVGVAAVASIVWGIAAGWVFALAIFGVQLVLWFVLLVLVFGTLAGLHADDLGDRVRPNLGTRRSLENFAHVFVLVVLAVGGVQALLTVLSPAGPDPTTSALISRASLDTPALAAMTELWRRDPARFQWIGVIGSTVSVAYLAGALRGGYAAVQHTVLRVLLWASGRLPLRLVSVLDDAARRGLLRRIGGGYLFVHRTLQDELAR
jgi:serine/threonine protein kinase/energy-coupling factor transporter ATP-binding protein EcfA2